MPATITYQIVLEAETLIDDYLRDEGQRRYIIDDDEVSRPARVAQSSRAPDMDGQIHVRFGRALDPFGNEVDDEGRSCDPHGRVVDARRYVFDADGRRGMTRRAIASTRGSSERPSSSACTGATRSCRRT